MQSLFLSILETLHYRHQEKRDILHACCEVFLGHSKEIESDEMLAGFRESLTDKEDGTTMPCRCIFNVT